MMHHFYPPRMKKRERERERAVMDEDEEGKREEARLYRLGRHIEELWEEGHTPLLDRGCLCFAILAVRQPASLPSPSASKTRGDRWKGGREGGEREEWEEEVSHENRLRIKRLKVIWYLYRGNVAKFDKDRKDGEESFFFLFHVLIMEMKEEITNRDIGF